MEVIFSACYNCDWQAKKKVLTRACSNKSPSRMLLATRVQDRTRDVKLEKTIQFCF